MGNLARVNLNAGAVRASEPLPDIHTDRVIGKYHIYIDKRVEQRPDSVGKHLYPSMPPPDARYSIHDVEAVNRKASLSSIYDVERAEAELQLTNMMSGLRNGI